jgi:hypothetical protein
MERSLTINPTLYFYFLYKNNKNTKKAEQVYSFTHERYLSPTMSASVHSPFFGVALSASSHLFSYEKTFNLHSIVDA